MIKIYTHNTCFLCKKTNVTVASFGLDEVCEACIHSAIRKIDEANMADGMAPKRKLKVWLPSVGQRVRSESRHAVGVVRSEVDSPRGRYYVIDWESGDCRQSGGTLDDLCDLEPVPEKTKP